MRNKVVIFVLIGILSLVQAALISVFPLPLALVNLPLIAVSALALGLKPKNAIIAAVMSGAIIDLLSLAPYGVYAMASFLSVGVTAMLLFRILTHHTIGAVVGVNAAVFVMFHLLVYIVNSTLRILSGGSIIHPATGYALLMVLAALPIQLALVIFARAAFGGVRGYASRFILVK